eukprot:10382717-Ditylum_brightwellii.AAC.1
MLRHGEREFGNNDSDSIDQPPHYSELWLPIHPAVCGACTMSWGVPLPNGEAHCCHVCRGNVGAVMCFHGTVVEDVDVTNVQEDMKG